MHQIPTRSTSLRSLNAGWAAHAGLLVDAYRRSSRFRRRRRERCFEHRGCATHSGPRPTARTRDRYHGERARRLPPICGRSERSRRYPCSQRQKPMTLPSRKATSQSVGSKGNAALILDGAPLMPKLGLTLVGLAPVAGERIGPGSVQRRRGVWVRREVRAVNLLRPRWLIRHVGGSDLHLHEKPDRPIAVSDH